LPRAQAADTQPDRFDAVIVGSGLGGLSCAAAFARQGFKALVLEQHDKPGGYATASIT
jgi:phytoene dehydrogenase-like protein